MHNYLLIPLTLLHVSLRSGVYCSCSSFHTAEHLYCLSTALHQSYQVQPQTILSPKICQHVALHFCGGAASDQGVKGKPRCSAGKQRCLESKQPILCGFYVEGAVLSALSWRVDGPRPLSPGQWLTIPHTKQTIFRTMGVRKPSLVILPGKSGFVNDLRCFLPGQIVGTLWTSQD